MNTNQRVLTGVVVLLFMLGLISILPIHGEAKIYDTVVRLHVLANSDSEQDQALKLQVRDEVLRVTGPMLKDCKSRDEAVAVLQEHGDEIRDAAQAVVKAQGYDYPVSILLGTEQYPTRNYENCCFPGGTYVSMRVCIGEAEGQNWWCVLFPPLCLGAASAQDGDSNEDAFISVGLTGEQYKVITETDNVKYRIRFKVLEAVQELLGKSK
ncbi:MAG: stage II sporulation protein R [Clostridia bacterium]|nr:stage II sporulation protein R [Clostridia bacterium]